MIHISMKNNIKNSLIWSLLSIMVNTCDHTKYCSADNGGAKRNARKPRRS
jgi:hypothetical protein